MGCKEAFGEDDQEYVVVYDASPAGGLEDGVMRVGG